MEYSYNEPVLCGNVAMRWNLYGPIKPSPWLKTSYWVESIFHPKCQTFQLCAADRLRWVGEINTGLRRPAARKLDWCEMDGDRRGRAVRSGGRGWREGAATLLCIRVKCLRSEMAAPIWIHIQTLPLHTNKQTAYGRDVRGAHSSRHCSAFHKHHSCSNQIFREYFFVFFIKFSLNCWNRRSRSCSLSTACI